MVRRVADGCTVAVRLSPRARREGVDGLAEDARGPVLKVAVTAPPVDGAANTALERLLARQWGLPKRDVRVIRGATDRHKPVKVTGDPSVVEQQLRAWMASHDG